MHVTMQPKNLPDDSPTNQLVVGRITDWSVVNSQTQTRKVTTRLKRRLVNSLKLFEKFAIT